MSVTEISAVECRQCSTVTMRSSGLCRRCDPSSKLNRGKVCTADREPVAASDGVVNEFGVEVGDVFVCSWGYDQTNVNYYEVVRVTAKCAEVRAINSSVENFGGAGGNRVVPVKGSDRGFDVLINVDRGDAKRTKLCKVKPSWRTGCTDPIIVLSDRYTATKYTGGGNYCTDSQFGH